MTCLCWSCDPLCKSLLTMLRVNQRVERVQAIRWPLWVYRLVSSRKCQIRCWWCHIPILFRDASEARLACKSFDDMCYSIDHLKCWNISGLTHASIWMINLKGVTIYRARLLLTWQYVNFPKSLNREGIIYPSVLSKHSSVLICGVVEKQSEMCHSVVKVINNVSLFCLMCAIAVFSFL